MFNKNITLIVPSKTKDGINLNLINNANDCFLQMVEMFGGATMSSVLQGGYKMQNGNIMTENIVYITSYASANQKLKDFFNFVNKIKIKYNQECIGIIINNEMQFI